MTTILPFLHFFFLGMILITTADTVLQNSIYSFFRHSIRSNPLNLSLFPYSLPLKSEFGNKAFVI